MTQLAFRKKLSILCLENTLDGDPNLNLTPKRGRKRSGMEHRMENFPPHCGSWQGNSGKSED